MGSVTKPSPGIRAEPFSFRGLWRNIFGNRRGPVISTAHWQRALAEWRPASDWDRPRHPDWPAARDAALSATDEQQAADHPVRLSDLSRLDVQPGDVLVYRHSGPIPQHVVEVIKGKLREFVPDERVKLMVIDDRAEIAVISPTATEAA